MNRFRNSESHKKIAKNMGFIAIFMFLAKLAGAAKEIIVAGRFGVSEVVDAYLLVFTLVMWLPIVWTIVLATVYVPLSRRLGPNELRIFTQELFGLTLVLGGLLATMIGTLLPLLVPVLWGDYSTQGQRQLQQMLMGLSPMIVGVFLAGLFSAQLLAMEKHSNTLFDGVPSLVLAIVLLVFSQTNAVDQFVFGSLLGVVLQVLGLGIILYRSDGVSTVLFTFRSRGWSLFRKAMGIMLVSQLVMGVIAPIDLIVAGQLGSGNIAVYGYAQRILLLGMGLGATAVARAILPILSDQQTREENSTKLVYQWSCVLFGIGLLALLIGWYLAQPVVALLFERGAFQAEDTIKVSQAFRYGLYQLPIYFAGIVLVQFFASRQLYWILFNSSVLAVIAKCASAFPLASRMGVEGIMLSSALMYLVTGGYLLFELRRRRFVAGDDREDAVS